MDQYKNPQIDQRCGKSWQMTIIKRNLHYVTSLQWHAVTSYTVSDRYLTEIVKMYTYIWPSLHHCHEAFQMDSFCP